MPPFNFDLLHTLLHLLSTDIFKFQVHLMNKIHNNRGRLSKCRILPNTPQVSFGTLFLRSPSFSKTGLDPTVALYHYEDDTNKIIYFMNEGECHSMKLNLWRYFLWNTCRRFDAKYEAQFIHRITHAFVNSFDYKSNTKKDPLTWSSKKVQRNRFKFSYKC